MHSRILSALVAALVALPVARSAAHAQGATARLEGTVTDSIHARPLVGGTILVTRMAPDPAASFGVLTDERGRYRLDTLPAGRYTVGLWHPILDSLELSLPMPTIDLREGQRARLDLAIPSGATIRANACPGVSLPPGTGVLTGEVWDADADRPLAGAVVAVRWSDLTIDRATLRVSSGERTAGVGTNADGRYRICGLPTDGWLAVQVQHSSRGGSVLRASIADSTGLLVLNVSFSTDAARPLASDSVASDESAPLRLLTGTAHLAGTVLGETGQPLTGVQLRVLETAATARTDSAGRYALTALPAGTHLLEAKRIGYRIVQQPVHLARGRDVEVAIRLQRVVSLDSIRIVARRSRYREFESHRKGGYGRFLTEDDIEKRNATQVTDLIRMMPGLRIVGAGFDAKVMSSRGSGSLLGRPCEMNVVIDGMQRQDINWVQPSHIGAMEVYAGPVGAPILYDHACGVVVIWTKR